MDTIAFDDFSKVDIRIGTVVKAEVPSWSHWVIKLTVDLGPEIGTKMCFSGIMKFFKPEDLENNQYPFVVNLEPKKIGPDGDFSECMMIMATPSPKASEGQAIPSEEDTPPILFHIAEKVENGCKVR